MEFLEKICTEYITTHILYFVGLANCVHACIKLSGYVVVTCVLFRKSHARFTTYILESVSMDEIILYQGVYSSACALEYGCSFYLVCMFTNKTTRN